eukprot:jgi/Tetstr1/437286/TSEL_026015.t2
MGDESAPSDEAASTLSSGHQAQDPEEISCEQGLLVSPGSRAEVDAAAGGGAASSGRRALLLAGGGMVASARLPAEAEASKAAAASISVVPGGAADLGRKLEERVTDFSLPNGLRFIVAERHAAPTVACRTYADVGAFDEADGSTGIAHLLEHMAFKGSARIGTRDFTQEAPLLDAMDEVFYELRELQAQRAVSVAGKVGALRERLAALQDSARRFQVPNDFGSILEREGAVGLNAATSQDSTQYFVSLPANKLELWMALEAERFRAPVFRELYSEKQVVLEERSARVSQAPLGRYLERYQALAFRNNYRRPTIGYEADIAAIGRRELDAFFRQHYGPSALTIAVAGDVKPEEVRRLAEKYFGDWRAAEAVPPAPAGSGPRNQPPRLAGAQPPEIWWPSDAGPLVMDGYYHGAGDSADAVVRDVLCDLLYGSRASRLYSRLVRGGTALACTTIADYPGDKYPGMSLIYAVPAEGVSLRSCAEGLRSQVEALGQGGAILQRELDRVRKQYRVEVLQSISQNAALASALVRTQALTGSWRSLITDLEVLEELTPRDLERGAAALFRPDNRFTGYVLPSSQRLPPDAQFDADSQPAA